MLIAQTEAPRYTVLEVLQDKWWIGVAALLVSLAATPVVRRVLAGKGMITPPLRQPTDAGKDHDGEDS